MRVSESGVPWLDKRCTGRKIIGYRPGINCSRGTGTLPPDRRTHVRVISMIRDDLLNDSALDMFQIILIELQPFNTT